MTNYAALKGRRVLFIAPRFFGYDQDIAEELERRGAHVTRLLDRPYGTPIMTAATKLSPQTIARIALPGYREVLQTNVFDIIFVVNGQTIPAVFLTELRRHSPNATFILYLWDSLRNRGSIVPALPNYDHIFGFDRSDAEQYGFRYRPLFFAPVFDVIVDQSPRYDISFIATAHTDRAAIVAQIDARLTAEVTRFWYLFLQAPWVRRYYALKDRAFRQVPADLFHYEPMPKSEIARIFQQSRTILDIEHPFQRGLTMRTLETVGAQKKLVTTNARVQEEDFYDRSNIHVIERKSARVDADFLRQPYEPLPEALRARYSLAGWMDEILSGSGCSATPLS